MKETKFKDTEIGKIPEEWSICNFGDLFTFFSNNTLSRDMLGERGDMHNVHYGDVLIKYGSTLDVEKESIPSIKEEYCYKSTNKIEDGDVIIADTAEDETVGKACEILNVGSKYIVSGLHTIWVRPKGNLFAAKYLGYAMNGATYHNQLLPLIQGTKVSSISKAAIKDTCIIVPPINEQHSIASALTSIDNLIASLGKLIEKKKNIKQGAMQQLLTGKTRLKGFTEPWVEKKLGDVAVNYTGLTYSPMNVKSYGTLVLRSSNIQKGILVFNDNVFVDMDIPSRAIAKKNDLLICVRNGSKALIGKSAVITDYADGMAFGAFMTILHANDIQQGFLNYLWQADYIQQQVKDNMGATINQITNADIEQFKIVVPHSLKEQQAIATILTKMDNEITALEAKRAKYEAIKQGMMQQLLTGKIRLIS